MSSNSKLTKADDDEGETALSPTEIHDVLRNERRRLVLTRLSDTEGGESVRDLAEHIASIEAGESPPPRNVRQSVYVSLHQTHLPKLDELEIVEYDDDAKEVYLDGKADAVTAFLDVDDADDAGEGVSWQRVCIGAAVLGLAALVGHALGVPGLAAADASLVGGVFLAAVLAIAGYSEFTPEEPED